MPRSTLDFSQIFPDLTVLSLHFGSLGDNDDLGISNNIHLQALKIFSPDGTAGFYNAYMPSIKSLYLVNNVNCAGFNNMHAFPNLELVHLYLDGIASNNDHFIDLLESHKDHMIAGIEQLVFLKKFHIAAVNINDKYRMRLFIGELQERFPEIAFTVDFRKAF